jgi:outer membrane protein assembly factor BamA
MSSSRLLIAFGVAALAGVWPSRAAGQEGEPGGPPVVRSLSFRGNEAIDDRTLRLSIASRQASWPYRFPLTRLLGLGSKPPFDETEFRRDVLRIKALYGVRGFPNARVDTTIRRDDRDVSITVHIAENRPVRVDAVRVLGVDGILDLEGVAAALPLQPGDPFDRFAFQR